MREGALAAAVDDLDAVTLEVMRTRLACTVRHDAGTRAACGGLDAFARGERPDAKRLAEKRLVGVGMAVNAAGVVDPKLELLALDYRREENFHAAVELGDALGVVPVVSQSPDESKQIAEATTALLDGKTPDGNQAFEFARTMDLPHAGRVVGTTGKSQGVTGENRRLIRQGDGKLVVIELAKTNSHVAGKPFWVQVFDDR